VLGQLTCRIDDRVVELRIKEKEEAKNNYSDAIAAGN
jgi:hypothetical protein